MAYEDFGDFTEVDPDGELTVTANKIHITDQNHDGDSRVYKDYEVDHFDGNFTHQFELVFTTLEYDGLDNVNCGVWGLSNTPDGLSSFADDDVLLNLMNYNGEYLLQLRQKTIPPWNIDNSSVLDLTTKYYITVARSGTDYNVTIRTGSHAGDVVDTLTIDLGAVKAFRYLYMQFEYTAE